MGKTDAVSGSGAARGLVGGGCGFCSRFAALPRAILVIIAQLPARLR
jgi:hypothetical protein